MRVLCIIAAVFQVLSGLIIAADWLTGKPADWAVWFWAILGVALATINSIEAAVEADARLRQRKEGVSHG